MGRFRSTNIVAARIKHIIASGITPSGEFHIGHLREILTGDMIMRACKNAGMDAEFVFIVDSADPLVGCTLSYPMNMNNTSVAHPATIPAPDENGKPGNDGRTYAQHFLEPFLAALEQIDVRPRIIDNYTSYANGEFAEKSRIACEKADEIREIIERSVVANSQIIGSHTTHTATMVVWMESQSPGLNGLMFTGNRTELRKSDLNKADGKLL